MRGAQPPRKAKPKTKALRIEPKAKSSAAGVLRRAQAAEKPACGAYAGRAAAAQSEAENNKNFF